MLNDDTERFQISPAFAALLAEDQAVADRYREEYTPTVEIPVGSVVIYHGSVDWHHGPMVVVEPMGGLPNSLTLVSLERFDSGWESGDRPTIWNVRQKSITLVVLPDNGPVTDEYYPGLR